jgi:hypothetical protein
MTRPCRSRSRRRTPYWLKIVHVSPYARFRFGRWENVSEHYRSLPGTQLAFDF